MRGKPNEASEDAVVSRNVYHIYVPSIDCLLLLPDAVAPVTISSEEKGSENFNTCTGPCIVHLPARARAGA